MANLDLLKLRIKKEKEFTVEQWREISRGWHKGWRSLAYSARKIPYNNRRKTAEDGFEKTPLEKISGSLGLFPFILALPEEALDRLIASFDEEERKEFSTK